MSHIPSNAMPHAKPAEPAQHGAKPNALAKYAPGLVALGGAAVAGIALLTVPLLRTAGPTRKKKAKRKHSTKG